MFLASDVIKRHFGASFWLVSRQMTPIDSKSPGSALRLRNSPWPSFGDH